MRPTSKSADGRTSVHGDARPSTCIFPQMRISYSNCMENSVRPAGRIYGRAALCGVSRPLACTIGSCNWDLCVRAVLYGGPWCRLVYIPVFVSARVNKVDPAGGTETVQKGGGWRGWMMQRETGRVKSERGTRETGIVHNGSLAVAPARAFPRSASILNPCTHRAADNNRFIVYASSLFVVFSHRVIARMNIRAYKGDVWTCKYLKIRYISRSLASRFLGDRDFSAMEAKFNAYVPSVAMLLSTDSLFKGTIRSKRSKKN